LLNNNIEYKRILNGAKLALADGIGVLIGFRLIGKRLKQRISGVDLVRKSMQACIETAYNGGLSRWRAWCSRVNGRVAW
jgi:N-acetylglucosaminyldiphosphoundecaprenol N-acetyl-beta-D-mannosaminyltransferase